MRAIVIHSHEKNVEPRQHAPESFDEVGEHPRRMNERELPLRPGRTVELRGAHVVARSSVATSAGAAWIQKILRFTVSAPNTPAAITKRRNRNTTRFSPMARP